MIETQTLLFALLGGFLPALLWLWFWLKEDSRCPEPRHVILFAFFAGMAAVPLVLPLERAAISYFSGSVLLLVWALIEEVAKYLLAFILVLRRRDLNEPIDAVLYMITVALGFAALENTFFLLSPLIDQNITNSILTGNLRFLGATLLHTLSSALVGAAIALAYYKKDRVVKFSYLLTGLVLATTLHTFFNFSIM